MRLTLVLVLSLAAVAQQRLEITIEKREPGAWTMFYFFGALKDETPVRMLRRADSADLSTWKRAETLASKGKRCSRRSQKA